MGWPCLLYMYFLGLPPVDLLERIRLDLENIFERSRKFAQNVLGKLGLLLASRAPAMALHVI